MEVDNARSGHSRGLVVTPEEVGERDIGIQNGTIVALATPGTLPTEAVRVIEAQGHIARWYRAACPYRHPGAREVGRTS